MTKAPAGLLYSRSHEWVRVEADDIVTIGITDHAQDELGDIVYVELPNVGRVLAVDDILGTVESVKAVSEIYSPLSGVVTETNESLVGSEAVINDDPYGQGWMIKMRMGNTGDLSRLLDADAYQAEFDD